MSRIAFLLVGVVLGMLIAPEKGSTTRRRISNTFTDLSDGVDEFSGSIKNTVADVRDNLQGAARDVKTDVGNNW